MSLPWLDQPVMLHSSRDSGKCSMTPEQCAYKSRYWVFWYEADHRYALPTTAFFLAVILVVSIGNLAGLYAPMKVRRNALWLRLLSLCRFLSYKSWRFRSWNTQSLAVYILGATGITFFAAMTLGPRPYYWPNTKDLSFGNSPPIATRAGYLALACMPFLFVLGAKSNPISTLTGISHEKLNVWHNWVAWAMFVLALIHTFPFIIFHIWKGDIVKSWNDGGTWVTGVIALLAQAWLTFMSIRWIRDRYYEFFKATHFVAAAIFFIFFFIHCDFRLTSWDYFIATAVLYSLCWFYSQFRTYLEHGLNYATLSLETPNSLKIAIKTNTKWMPGQHAYLRFLTSGVHTLTAHPFTIASVPQHGQKSDMVFYIRPRGGTTGRLAKIAEKSPGRSIPVLLDGPYGGVTSRWFLGFDRTLVVVGGAGAGFSLPIIENFLTSRAKSSELTVVVASHDPGFRSWYLQVLNDITDRQSMSEGAKNSHISVLVHETGHHQSNPASSLGGISLETGDGKEAVESTPNSLNESSITIGAIHVQILPGRPDIPSIAQETTEKQGTVGLMVCGPASMVFDLRKSATAAQTAIVIGEAGANEVWFYNESFS
ncbi:ferric reductase transmembrane [Colletotrichum truncatum]|uniref:Ferric reductase transmembrane n=1 Tax=Colletotrichum truncatum TaxID=5467 RepID=A0ACC3YYP2_COLTU|nr:ferric reductase transmembrane [Colletotrichum truncatum]KAF6781809.1 ferric reductase transmembrane [Colletotrichum truncatum]